MGLKKTVQKQYQSIVNEAAVAQSIDLNQPPEGWIASVRKALGMSAAELGRRVNRTRANITAAESSEQNDKATIQTMKTMAEAMGCKFVYGIVPDDGRIEKIIEHQARKKAEALVNQAGTHMALEQQSLSTEKTDKEIQRLAMELMDKFNSDFWKDDK